MGAEMHRFGFVCLRHLGRFWGGLNGSCGEALTPRTHSEDMDILDFAPLQLRWVGTGSSHFQVNFLNPSTRTEKKQSFLNFLFVASQRSQHFIIMCIYSYVIIYNNFTYC